MAYLIRLTYLIPSLLRMVDVGALGFKAATVDAIPEEEAKAVDEIVRIAAEDIQTESETKQDAEQEDGQKEETGDR